MEFPSVSEMLEPAFGIPTDVTFQIMENIGLGVESEVVVREINGHKMILALCSKVFRRQFFGKAKDSEEVIPIRQTTAFEIMIDYIYKKEDDLYFCTIDELFDAVNLAEKYFLLPLKGKVKNLLETFPITMETVIKIASTASKYKQFPEITRSVQSSWMVLSARRLNCFSL